AREHGRRADLLVGEHAKELAEAVEPFLEQASDRLVGRVARREPGATADEDRLDLRAQEPCLDLLANALRLVRKDRVLDDAVPELDQEVTRQGAARIGL